jgi:NAD(P)-dependent dehydrogenase (short-subunit alcohol dehydrogenase family)
MNVEGCTALITGANRRLGRALAGVLVQGGARKVYAAARDPTAITDSRLTPVQLNVTSFSTLLFFN